MKIEKYLAGLPEEIRGLINLAGAIAEAKRYPAYAVGGFVRDLLLGIKNLDLDIVVEGDGIKFAEALCVKLKAGLIRHKRFATATLMTRQHLKIDIATARKEYYPLPALLPVVSAGTLNDDLGRRDFTVNAMAVGISKSNYAQLIDPFGGLNDLAKREINVLHGLSFIDDPTRILRAIRFEQRYDFHIAKPALKYLSEALDLKMLEKVQPQRLREEIILLLKEDQPIKGIKRLERLCGLDFISPKLKLKGPDYQLLGSIHKEVSWFKKSFLGLRELDGWLVYFMGMINRLGIKATARVVKRFVFRKGEEKRIIASKKIAGKIVSKLSRANLRPSDLFDLLEPLSYETIIFFKAGLKDRRLCRNIAEFLNNLNGQRLSITGHDLKAMGVLPGPDYRRLFRKVLKAKLNGLILGRAEELALARKLLKL